MRDICSSGHSTLWCWLTTKNIQKSELIPLRCGVALVQHLREAYPVLEISDLGASYSLDQKISPVFYKYSRLSVYVPDAPQDIHQKPKSILPDLYSCVEWRGQEAFLLWQTLQFTHRHIVSFIDTLGLENGLQCPNQRLAWRKVSRRGTCRRDKLSCPTTDLSAKQALEP